MRRRWRAQGIKPVYLSAVSSSSSQMMVREKKKRDAVHLMEVLNPELLLFYRLISFIIRILKTFLIIQPTIFGIWNTRP